jgi:hypothetical protein
MPKTIDEILFDVKTNHNIDQYFYPRISMETDLDRGLRGEVKTIVEMLEKNGFAASSENVANTMQLKKTLLEKYEMQERKTVDDYRKLLLEEVKPVGSAIGIELLLVNGIVILALYMLGRFAGSFADEAGKIAAKKLLEKDEKQAKKLNMSTNEYRIFVREFNLLVQQGEIANFEGDLQKSVHRKTIKKGNKKKKVRSEK